MQEQVAVLDRDELVERMDGDEVLCNDLLRLFATDAPKALTRIREAIASEDAGQLQREAHALKGAAAYVAARTVQRAAERLEQAGGQRSLDRAHVLLRHLAREIDRVCDKL